MWGGGSNAREFASEVFRDLPNLAPRATSLIDITTNVERAGDLAAAPLVPSTRFIQPHRAAWSNNPGRVMARIISPATFSLAAAMLSVTVAKRRVQ